MNNTTRCDFTRRCQKQIWFVSMEVVSFRPSFGISGLDPGLVSIRDQFCCWGHFLRSVITTALTIQLLASTKTVSIPSVTGPGMAPPRPAAGNRLDLRFRKTSNRLRSKLTRSVASSHCSSCGFPEMCKHSFNYMRD